MSTGLNGVDSARAALAQGKPALVWRKVVADTETPVGAALKLFEDGRGDFLLESVEGGEVRGRYSLIGLDPDLVFRATGNDAAINAQWQFARDAFEPCAADTLESLRSLQNCAPATPEASSSAAPVRPAQAAGRSARASNVPPPLRMVVSAQSPPSRGWMTKSR